MTEKHLRSFTKSITWRFLATFTTMLLVYIFTKEITLSLGIGFFDIITKLFIYYFHERAWNSINWGRK